MKPGFLRPLYQVPAGYVSVYLDTSRAHENAPEEVGLRWRAARERLRRDGADEATLDAVQDVVTDPAQAAPGRAVFARHGAVVFMFPLGAPPRREIARVAPLPHLMPLLAQNPPPPPHLLVSANRAGGEVVTVTGRGEASHDTVTLRGWPVHKVPVGGWSQARLQRSAEETWQENAKELASAVTEAASKIHAEHIVIGGDTRAQSLVYQHLATPLQAMTTVVELEVAADGTAMTEAADRAISAHAQEQARQRYDVWQTQRAHSGAVEGLDRTLAALRDGRVAELFVADRPTSTAEAWIGPGGTDVAVSEAELRERGVAAPRRDRADSAIVRALVTTDAELFFLPEDIITPGETGAGAGISSPRDGVCATLRWVDGSRSGRAEP